MKLFNQQSTVGTPGRAIIGSFALVVVLVVTGCSVVAAQQEDQSLREFRAPNPGELSRLLSAYHSNQDSQPSPNEDQIGNLKKGLEFLSSLSPEQQEQAWSYAENYLREHGLESEDSRALMDQFGVPPETQRELTEQFRQFQRSGDRETSSFSDAMKRAKDIALEQVLQRENQSSPRQNDNLRPDAESPLNQAPTSWDQPEPGQPNPLQSNSDPDQPETGRRDDQLNKGSTEFDPANPDRPTLDETRDDLSEVNPSASNQKADQPLDSNAIGQNGLNNRDGIRPEGSMPWQGFDQPELKSASPASPGGEGAAAGRLPDQTAFGWEQALRELAQQSGGSPRGNDANPTGGTESIDGNNSALNRLLKDPKFQTNVFEALQDRMKDGTSPFGKDLLSRVGESRSKSKNDPSALPERLTARFDRLVVDAVNKSLESGSGSVSDGDVSGSVGSVLDKLIDRINQSEVEPKQLSDSRSFPDQPTEDWTSTPVPPDQISSPLERSPTRTAARRARPDDSSPPSPRADFRMSNPLDSLPSIPKVDPSSAVTFLAFVGMLILLVCLLVRRNAVQNATPAAKKFGKRFRNAKIHSPNDLVEAVDHFLISKFGSDSRWWNAKYAQSILSEDAPDFSAKISELIKDYVRARYMRAEVTLSEIEQRRYKSILQELSQPANKPAFASPAGTKG